MKDLFNRPLAFYPPNPDETPLQYYQRCISAVLEDISENATDRELQALLTYTVRRATIVLAPSTAKPREAA